MYKRVLVLGGTGFVGKRLQMFKPNWVYIGSKHYNLLDKHECKKMFKEIDPDAVIHLAGKVGGIKENALKQAEFYYENTIINSNVINEAKNAGIKRVLSSLSTCSFPDVVQAYPFKEEDILKGPPSITNLSYGFAKRALFIQSNAYRNQYGLNYSCFSPSNIYGPGDNFENDKSHFVPAMIRKISTVFDGDEVEFWGTGQSLRQQLFVDDLVRIIPLLLQKHNTDCPIIVAPNENLSIKEMVECCIEISKKKIRLFFNGKLDGQYRKDGSNQKLLQIIGNFKFINFKDGLKKTYDFYNAEKGVK